MWFTELLAVGAVIFKEEASKGTVTWGNFFKYSKVFSQENLARPKDEIFSRS